jgi:hypothetical protein
MVASKKREFESTSMLEQSSEELRKAFQAFCGQMEMAAESGESVFNLIYVITEQG